MADDADRALRAPDTALAVESELLDEERDLDRTRDRRKVVG